LAAIANSRRIDVDPRTTLGLALVLATPAISAPLQSELVDQLRDSNPWSDSLSGLPLTFVENLGQWKTPARFIANAGPMIARLEPNAIGIELRELEGAATQRALTLRMEFIGADAAVTMEGGQRLPGTRNYFLGKDPQHWHTGVAGYAAVLHRGLYPGIDLRLREHAGRLEYDLMLAAGADVTNVLVRCEGIEGLVIEEDGALRMESELGPVLQSPPRTWEVLEDGERREIECRFVLHGECSFGFALSARDPSRAVVIDPGLEWSTLYGGSLSDLPLTVEWDATRGRAIVAGESSSLDLPGVSGSYSGGSMDAFVASFAPSASGSSQLVWASYFGGSDLDRILDLALDDQGNLLVVGQTVSTDYPTFPTGAYDTSFNGGTHGDAFVAKLSEDGNLLYSTYLGGSMYDYAASIAQHGPNSVSVVGSTFSDNLPTTSGAFQTARAGERDDFMAQLTLAGGGPLDLTYCTYLGGTSWEGSTPDVTSSTNMRAVHVATVGTGRVMIAGRTQSVDFPIAGGAYSASHSGAYDFYIVRLNPAGASAADLEYSTFVGGTGTDSAQALLVTSPETVVVSGYSYSTDLPTTPGCLQPSFAGDVGHNDACIFWLDLGETGSSQLAYLSYVGTLGYEALTDLVSDGGGGVIGVGFTGPLEVGSTSFPTTSGAWDRTMNGLQDAFVLQLVPGGLGVDDLLYSTVIGGTGHEAFMGVSLVPGGGPPRVVAAGPAWGSVPTTPGTFQQNYNGGQDGWLIQLELSPVMTTFCFGDGGGTACPCGNGSTPGAEQGCANSSGQGGMLQGSGSTSASADDLGFNASNLLASQPALLFSGLNAVNGGDGIVFGDGLRCAGVSVVRLGVSVPNIGGNAIWGPSLAGVGGWSAGDTRRFQGWYRDPGGPCGSQFNLTNGVEVVFAP
jgi:hypothetical protein